MKVYALCRECDDYYYGFTNPSRVFSSKEKAIEEATKLVNECADEETELKVESESEHKILVYLVSYNNELKRKISASDTYAIFEYELE